MGSIGVSGNEDNETIQDAIDDSYVYRGPKNTTGIFKNSMLLKDMTDYFEAELAQQPNDIAT